MIVTPMANRTTSPAAAHTETSALPHAGTAADPLPGPSAPPPGHACLASSRRCAHTTAQCPRVGKRTNGGALRGSRHALPTRVRC